MAYRFTTPTVSEGPAGEGRLFERFRLVRGITVLKIDGEYFEIRFPSQEETQAAEIAYIGCKIIGLQLNPGDSSSQKMVSNKKWDSELEAYRAARAEGIQPAGTSMKKIQEARRASDVMGKAFDANTMGDSKIIQNNTVSKLKEVGAI